jgi:hypothetical protein
VGGKKKKERRKSSFRNICTLFLLAHLSGALASTKQQRFSCFVAMEVGKEALVSESRRKERGVQLHWTALDWTGFGNWTENWTGLATD